MESLGLQSNFTMYDWMIVAAYMLGTLAVGLFAVEGGLFYGGKLLKKVTYAQILDVFFLLLCGWSMKYTIFEFLVV